MLRGTELEDLGVAPVQGKPFVRVREVLTALQGRGLKEISLGLTGAGAAQVAALFWRRAGG